MGTEEFLKRYQQKLATLSGTGQQEPIAMPAEPAPAPAATAPKAQEDADIYLPRSMPAQSAKACASEAHVMTPTERLKIEASENAALRYLHSLDLKTMPQGAFERTKPLNLAELEAVQAKFSPDLIKRTGLKIHHESGEIFATVNHRKFSAEVARMAGEH